MSSCVDRAAVVSVRSSADGERATSTDRLPTGAETTRAVRRTTAIRVFRLAAALVVVDALLDAFVLVEPGVSRADHLPAAFAVTLVVALGGIAFSRVSPGGRAAIAFALGGLMLVRAGVAVADAADGDPTADDWPALVLLPAGVALLALAAAEAWGSRRPGRWRWLRRGLRGAVVLLAAYWVLVPVAVAIVATEKPRSTPGHADLGRPHEDMALTTSDGLRLAAWYVPSRNGAAVIAFPGRSGPVGQARMLVRHGYGVLLLDPRGEGESEGDPNAFGWRSRLDLDAAIAFLRTRPDVKGGRIGGLGLSVGGELMIETAAANHALRAVVSEGAGERSVRETLLLGPRGWLSLPAAAVETTAVWILSGTPPPPALDSAAAALAPRPLLLVYGADGQEAERDLNPRYFAAAREPKEIWEVPAAGHTGGLAAEPAAYERRIVGFFDAALQPNATPDEGA